jgi:hypothetical protein
MQLVSLALCRLPPGVQVLRVDHAVDFQLLTLPRASLIPKSTIKTDDFTIGQSCHITCLTSMQDVERTRQTRRKH